VTVNLFWAHFPNALTLWSSALEPCVMKFDKQNGEHAMDMECDLMYRTYCMHGCLTVIIAERTSILKNPTNRVCGSVFETIRCQMDDLLTEQSWLNFRIRRWPFWARGRMTWTIFNFSLGRDENPLRSLIFVRMRNCMLVVKLYGRK
jgi:hypothetical protein